jgi:methionine synthase II (cobalamin-independent)
VTGRRIYRFLTTHAGGLPRPDPLVEAGRAIQAGEPTGRQGYAGLVTSAVADIVGRQKEIGIDMDLPAFVTMLAAVRRRRTNRRPPPVALLLPAAPHSSFIG